MYIKFYNYFLWRHADYNIKFISDLDVNYIDSVDLYANDGSRAQKMRRWRYNKYKKLYSFRYGFFVDDYYSDSEIDFTKPNSYNTLLYITAATYKSLVNITSDNYSWLIFSPQKRALLINKTKEKYNLLLNSNNSYDEFSSIRDKKFHSLLHIMNVRDEDLREVDRFKRAQKYYNNLLVYNRFSEFEEFFFFQLGFFKRDIYKAITFKKRHHLYFMHYRLRLLKERRKKSKLVKFTRQRITKEEREICNLARNLCMWQGGIVKRRDYLTRLAVSQSFSRVDPLFLYTYFPYATGRVNVKYYQEIIERYGIKFRKAFLRFINLPTTEPVYFSHYKPVNDIFKYRREQEEIDEFKWQVESIQHYYKEERPLRFFQWDSTLFYTYLRPGLKLIHFIFFFNGYSFFFSPVFYWLSIKKKIPNTQFYGMYHSFISCRINFFYANFKNSFWFYYIFINFTRKCFRNIRLVFKFRRLFNNFNYLVILSIFNLFIYLKKKKKGFLVIMFFFFKLNKKYLKKKFKLLFYNYCYIFNFFYNINVLYTRRIYSFFLLKFLFNFINYQFSNFRNLNCYRRIYFSLFFYSFSFSFSFISYFIKFFFFIKRFYYMKQWSYRKRQKLKQVIYVLDNVFLFMCISGKYILFLYGNFFFNIYLDFFLNIRSYVFYNFFFNYTCFPFLKAPRIAYKLILYDIYKRRLFLFLLPNLEYELLPIYETDTTPVNYDVHLGLSNWIWWVVAVLEEDTYLIRFFWQHWRYYIDLVTSSFLSFKFIIRRYWINVKIFYSLLFRLQTGRFYFPSSFKRILKNLKFWRENFLIKNNSCLLFNYTFFIGKSFIKYVRWANYFIDSLKKMSFIFWGDIYESALLFFILLFYSLRHAWYNLQLSYLNFLYYKLYANKIGLLNKFFFYFSIYFFSNIYTKRYFKILFYFNIGRDLRKIDNTIRYLLIRYKKEFFSNPLKLNFYLSNLALHLKKKHFSLKKNIFFFKINFFIINFYLNNKNSSNFMFYKNIKFFMHKYSLNLYATGSIAFNYWHYWKTGVKILSVAKYESRLEWSTVRRSKAGLRMIFESHIWPRFFLLFFSAIYPKINVLHYLSTHIVEAKRFTTNDSKSINNWLNSLSLYFLVLKKKVRRHYIKYFLYKYSDVHMSKEWIDVATSLYARRFSKVYKKKRFITYFFSKKFRVEKKGRYRRIYGCLSLVRTRKKLKFYLKNRIVLKKVWGFFLKRRVDLKKLKK